MIYLKAGLAGIVSMRVLGHTTTGAASDRPYKPFIVKLFIVADALGYAALGFHRQSTSNTT